MEIMVPNYNSFYKNFLDSDKIIEHYVLTKEQQRIFDHNFINTHPRAILVHFLDNENYDYISSVGEYKISKGLNGDQIDYIPPALRLKIYYNYFREVLGQCNFKHTVVDSFIEDNFGEEIKWQNLYGNSPRPEVLLEERMSHIAFKINEIEEVGSIPDIIIKLKNITKSIKIKHLLEYIKDYNITIKDLNVFLTPEENLIVTSLFSGITMTGKTLISNTGIPDKTISLILANSGLKSIITNGQSTLNNKNEDEILSAYILAKANISVYLTDYGKRNISTTDAL